MATSTFVIESYETFDIRFPTSLEQHGSDAMHVDPDYSCAYLILKSKSNDHVEGHGLNFTCGRGTEVIIKAIEAYMALIVGTQVSEIYSNFGAFCKRMSNESQLRWLGPEKGVVHLALSTILNALWDLWGKLEGKPVWKLVTDMNPEEIASLVDFTYITDVITREEVVELLEGKVRGKETRLQDLVDSGYPAYTTSAGWYGYSNEKIRGLLEDYLALGWTKFKIKVGSSVEEDKKRLALVRETIGDQSQLMVDANQRWEVNEAIEYMEQLDEFKLEWIEEPTCPDDIAGHRTIKEALKHTGVKVATGEHCQNRVMFKQFLASGALDICQIDSCRLGSINEMIAVLLMASKLDVAVCPHAGGVGLCEYVQHIIAIDYLTVSGRRDDRVCEYADHLHQHFKERVKVIGGRYYLPRMPGYTEMKRDSISDYSYPDGKVWVDIGKAKLCESKSRH